MAGLLIKRVPTIFQFCPDKSWLIRQLWSRKSLGTSAPVSAAAGDARRLETAQAGSLLDIGTRPILSEEHDIIRQSARKFFQQEVMPIREEIEKLGHLPREIWAKAGAQGLLGIAIPAEDGGHGGDYITETIMAEEHTYADALAGGFVLHSTVALPYISNYGTLEQKQKYITGAVDGTNILAIAMTEPGAGSDLQGIRTVAKKDGDDWILNGSKVFITNGIACNAVIVVALTQTDANSPAHGISLFIVDDGMPGFTKGKNLKKIGLKSMDTAELFFDDVRLPGSAVLGRQNKGFYQLMEQLPQERLIIANMGVAHAEYMFEQTRTYVKERKAFGKTLAHLQTIQHKLAEMKTEICIARSFVDRCTLLHNEGNLGADMASMAKYWSTDLAQRVATECLQLHGGMGYMWEMPIARAFVDARVQPIYGGSNEIMKELIARQIVK